MNSHCEHGGLWSSSGLNRRISLYFPAKQGKGPTETSSPMTGPHRHRPNKRAIFLRFTARYQQPYQRHIAAISTLHRGTMPQSNPTVVILGADFGGLKNKDSISQLKRCWAIATAFHASSVVPTLLREIWAVHKNLRTRNRKAVSQK